MMGCFRLSFHCCKQQHRHVLGCSEIHSC
ncbi:MAG: hypothetical protein GC192_18480 [Bacteroidetes bacterium]|nr:hypothetical protein [Bacteroidota bacterium]